MAGWSSSATTSACSTRSSTRCGTSTRTVRSSTSTTSAGRRTCSSARPTSGAGTGNGPTLNARSRRCAARPTRCGPRRRRPAPRTRCNAGRTQLAAGLAEVRAPDKVARLRFPAPAPCGRTPLTAEALSKSYGSLEVFTDVDLAVDRGARVVVLGLNGAGKTTLLRLLAELEPPDTGEVRHGHGLRLGYYAQEHETLDHDRTVLENMRTAAIDRRARRPVRHRPAQDARRVPVHRRGCGQTGRSAVRRREDAAGAGDAGHLGRQRAAAGRADEQPRPGQPRAGARPRCAPTPERSCW